MPLRNVCCWQKKRWARKPDAPRDKLASFREINGIAAAFQLLKKNYNSSHVRDWRPFNTWCFRGVYRLHDFHIFQPDYQQGFIFITN